jgi:gliding motility-associated-like protein
MKKFLKPLFTIVLFTIGVNAFAQPTVDFTASVAGGCAPVSINFTSIVTGCTGTPTYYWLAGNGEDSNNQNPTFNYSSGGSFTVTLEVTCDGFTVPKTMVVEIHNSPIAAFSTTPQTGCEPYSTTFFDLSTDGDLPINDWQWFFGDGLTSSEENPTHEYSNGLYSLGLIVTDPNDCSSQFTFPGLVSVAFLPEVSFFGDNPSWCDPPHEVNFFATVTTAFGLTSTLEWNFGDGSPFGAGSPVAHNYLAGGLYDVSLTATDAYGCVSLPAILEEYVQIVPATPEYSVLGGNIVCKGVTVQFSNETTYPCSWDFGDLSPVSYLSTPTHIYNSPGDKTVTFTVDPGGDCEAATTFNLFVEEVTAGFTVTSSTGELYSCTVPFTVDFTNTSSSNATGFFYVFQDGNSATIANPSHTYNTSGTFQPGLTVTTDNGCSNTAILPSPGIIINVPNVSIVGDTIEGCTPLHVEFTNVGTTPVGSITNWNWDFDNGQTNPNGSNTESATFNAGEYTVTLTIIDENDCVGTGTLDFVVGEPYIPNIGVTDNDHDHTPLPGHVLCAQDTISLYLQEWESDIYDFTWWMDSSNNVNATEEYTDYAFDQEVGLNYVNIITEYNGCIDTIYWETFFISGPIIKSIASESDCDFPLEYTFTLSDTLADTWDWYVYTITGDVKTILDSEIASTNLIFPYTFPYQGDFWLQAIAYSDTTLCHFHDSIPISISSPQAIFGITNPDVCVDFPIAFTGASSQYATEYYWDYGDGANSGWLSTPTANHSYSTVDDFTVTLTVRNGNGCENSMTADIHVIGPEIDIIADNVYGCNSLDVNFTDQSYATEPIQWVLWEFGDGEHVFGLTAFHNYSIPGTYDLTVTVKTFSGCEATRVYPGFITVDAIDASFESLDQIGCVGEEMTFNAVETDETYLYTWNFGDGPDLVGNNPNPTHQYSAGGKYNVYLKVDNGSGCIDEYTLIEYIVIQEPTANFSLSDSYFSCYPVEDLVITPNCSVNPPETIMTYYWEAGNGDDSNSPNPTFLYSAPGSFTITLNLSTNNGCTATYSKNIIIDGPSADVFISDDSVCVGQDILFELTNLLGVVSFEWVVGSGDAYNVESFTHSYDMVPLLGYNTVSLTLRSGEFCHPDFYYDIYVFDVTAGMLITDLDNIPTLSSCSPFDALLKSNSVNETSLEWHIDGTPYGSGQLIEPYTFVNNTADDQTVAVMLTAILSISDSDNTECKDSIESTFDVYALPIIEISNDTLICKGDEISIYANGGTNYSWSPDQSISELNSPTPSVNPIENIMYSVVVANARGCINQDSVYIAVQQEPIITLTPDIDTIIIGDTVFSVLVADQENMTYSWTPQTYISCFDCPQPYFFPEESMRYNLTVEDSMQCFRLHYYIDIVVREEYTLDVPMAFSPLGAAANRVVYADGFGIRKLIQFRIYNRWGQEVFYTDDIHKGWDGYLNGKLQNIDNYSYFVEAEMYDGTIKVKKGNILLMR